MEDLLSLYEQYRKVLYPGNPVTRSVLRQIIKDRIEDQRCFIVYRYLSIEYVD